MSQDSFLYAGIFFSVLLAGFLATCAIVLFLTEPSDDPFGDGPYGDVLALPDDFKVSHHSAGDTK